MTYTWWGRGEGGSGWQSGKEAIPEVDQMLDLVDKDFKRTKGKHI